MLLMLILFFIYSKSPNEEIYKGQIPKLFKENKEKELKRKKIILITITALVFFLGLFIYLVLGEELGILIMIVGPITLIFGSIQIKAALDFTEEDRRKILEYMKDNDPSKLPDENTLKKYERVCGLYPIGNKKSYSRPAYLNPERQLWMVYIYIIFLVFFAVRGYIKGNISGSMIFFGLALVMFFGIRYWYKKIKEGKYPLSF
jgi:hypothetical protein